MTIIEIAALSNGAHRNQTGATVCPDGWAVVPPELLRAWETAAPFADITVDGNVVTGIVQTQGPEPEPEPEIETTEQRLSDIEDAIIELAAIIAGEGE